MEDSSDPPASRSAYGSSAPGRPGPPPTRPRSGTWNRCRRSRSTYLVRAVVVIPSVVVAVVVVDVPRTVQQSPYEVLRIDLLRPLGCPAEFTPTVIVLLPLESIIAPTPRRRRRPARIIAVVRCPYTSPRRRRRRILATVVVVVVVIVVVGVVVFNVEFKYCQVSS